MLTDNRPNQRLILWKWTELAPQHISQKNEHTACGQLINYQIKKYKRISKTQQRQMRNSIQNQSLYPFIFYFSDLHLPCIQLNFNSFTVFFYNFHLPLSNLYFHSHSQQTQNLAYHLSSNFLEQPRNPQLRNRFLSLTKSPNQRESTMQIIQIP